MTLLLCILDLKSEYSKMYEMMLVHRQGDRCDLNIKFSHTFPYTLYGKVSV
jgi:hypothetical protein